MAYAHLLNNMQIKIDTILITFFFYCHSLNVDYYKNNLSIPSAQVLIVHP